MKELYVPLRAVLDLIDITNTADGFSNYNAYLDLHNAVESLPAIEKTDTVAVTERKEHTHVD